MVHRPAAAVPADCNSGPLSASFGDLQHARNVMQMIGDFEIKPPIII
jgi:hypothetical protein